MLLYVLWPLSGYVAQGARVVLMALGLSAGVLAIKRWRRGASLLLEAAEKNARATFKRPPFALKLPSFFEAFCWRRPINRCVMQHHDGAFSLLFTWRGAYNEFDGIEAFNQRMQRYNDLIKQLAHYPVTLEWHWERRRDDRAVDAYVRQDAADAPAIVKDIRGQMARLLRGQGRSNRVFGVLSIAPALSLKRDSAQAEALRALSQAFERVRSVLPDCELASAAEYAECVSRTLSPGENTKNYHVGQDVAFQLAYDKPEWSEAQQCLKKGDTYIKPVLLFQYPELTPDFFLSSLASLKTNLHVSQVIQAKHADSAIRRLRRQTLNQRVFTSETQSNWDDTQHSINDAEQFCAFVKQHGAAVADNVYMLVFSAQEDELEAMRAAFEAWSGELCRQGGELRCDRYIQYAVYLHCAPGMGRYSRFFREDTGFAIGRMTPDTVFDAGDPEPEILRLCANGQLYGYAPSKDVVLGQLIAGQTGGGKDAQFGLSVLETYQRIQYSIFEEGNSYQAIVEALGGRYCEAIHQTINPLSSYAAYDAACQRDRGRDNVISALRVVLLPLFKGFEHAAFSVEESVVLDAALIALYEAPTRRQAAPILPDLAQILAREAGIDPAYRAEQATLHKRLRAFLETSEGRRFQQADQFVLSPIINAINFEGLSGTLLRYYLGFMVERVSMNAFASGRRSQIVINEYRTLMSKAPDAIRWITLLLDRKGRKEWTGLTRITQGIDEILDVDTESLSSMGCKSLLSRQDAHQRLGRLLDMPDTAIALWSRFESPKLMDKKGYRDMLFSAETEHTRWQYFKLEFPELVLDLMTTAGADKAIRLAAMQKTQDVYERIRLIKAGRRP
ncbi:MAG: hypothetical protein P8104_02155 [Gammaproteobacteria bacterium]